jgi:hypothetical protein
VVAAVYLAKGGVKAPEPASAPAPAPAELQQT